MAAQKRDAEFPDFDKSYQESVLHLALTDQEYAKALVFHLTPEKGKKRLHAFTVSHFQMIFSCIEESIREYDKIPSEGHINNYIDERHEGEERELLKKIAKRLLTLEVPDPEYFKRNIGKYITGIAITNGLTALEEAWQESGSILATKPVLKELAVKIENIDLEESSFQTLSSFVDEFTDPLVKDPEYIKSMIPELDAALNGGFPKGSLVIFLGPNNIGKTTTVIDIGGCSAILQGKKVLHVPLDSDTRETRNRYISNLCDIPLQRVSKKHFNDFERNKIKEMAVKLDKNLLIYTPPEYGLKAEKLITKLESIKKTFDYDVVIMDYIGCLGTMERVSSLREVNFHTHRAMRNFAVKNEVVVHSPAQATRDGQKKINGTDAMRDKSGNYVLRTTDIAESDDIGRVAAIVITLNRTDQEANEERLRLYLDKQRQGRKGLLFGLHTNYANARVNTGKYYDPNVLVGAEEIFSGEGSKEGKDAKVFTERDREQVRKRCSTMIGEKRTLEDQVKTYNEKIEASQDPDEKKSFMEYRDSIQTRINDLVAKIKQHAALVFPGATPALLEQVQAQYADLEKNSSISKLDLDKAKLELTILKYLFMDLKK